MVYRVSYDRTSAVNISTIIFPEMFTFNDFICSFCTMFSFFSSFSTSICFSSASSSSHSTARRLPRAMRSGCVWVTQTQMKLNKIKIIIIVNCCATNSLFIFTLFGVRWAPSERNFKITVRQSIRVCFGINVSHKVTTVSTTDEMFLFYLYLWGTESNHFHQFKPHRNDLIGIANHICIFCTNSKRNPYTFGGVWRRHQTWLSCDSHPFSECMPTTKLNKRRSFSGFLARSHSHLSNNNKITIAFIIIIMGTIKNSN